MEGHEGTYRNYKGSLSVVGQVDSGQVGGGRACTWSLRRDLEPVPEVPWRRSEQRQPVATHQTPLSLACGHRAPLRIHRRVDGLQVA